MTKKPYICSEKGFFVGTIPCLEQQKGSLKGRKTIVKEPIMFFKKCRLKVGKAFKWFPRAVTLSRYPATTKDVAARIARMSTASPGDVHLVLTCLPTVMAQFMDEGRPVHIDGLGSFFFKLSCAGRGVDSPDEVGRQQIKSVRVQFLPERQGKGKQMRRPLTEGITLTEWGKTEDNDAQKDVE